MPVIFDFKCIKCGELVRDHMMKDSTEVAPLCPICSEPMEKQFSGLRTKKGMRHHNKLPSNYTVAQGGANFGRLDNL